MMATEDRIIGVKVVARRLFRACLLSLVTFAAPFQVPPIVSGGPAPVEPTSYVVGWGDTLSSIAQRYGTTVSAIAQANQVTNSDLIYVGQRLAIPGTTSPPPTGAGIHVVQAGDTLSAIAMRYHTTVHQLAQMNGLVNPNLIYVGQRLAVNEAPPANQDRDNTTYIVQRGDTLIGIATRYHVPMWDIVLANNIAIPSLIYVGQSLVIPGASPPNAVAPTVLPTATPVRTPIPSPTPPNTPAPRPPTATPLGPTPPPTPSYEFRYRQGSMSQFPNCGSVYFNGKITGMGGEPVDGRTVRLRFAGNTYYRVSGAGENPGGWGFAPLASEHYHSSFVFQIDILESQASPVPRSDTVEIQFTDCGVAGQFENIVFEYAGRAASATWSATSTAAHTPGPTVTPAAPLTPVEWDERLNELPCVTKVSLDDQGTHLRPGDRYWRLVSARWLSEEESRRDIQIYVDLLDEDGQRVFGERVVFENGGSYSVVSEEQSCCYPWDYPVKWPMFSALCSYSAHVEGLPSEIMIGMGLGTPEHPDWTIHTGFILTFRRSVYR